MDTRMDTFLQLVPVESEYDDEDLIAADGRADRHDAGAIPLQSDPGEHETSSFFSGHVSSPNLVHLSASASAAANASAQMDRARFLAHAQAVEDRMQAADEEVAQRILSMRRILELKDPMEQLAEYVALSLEPRREADTDIVAELLECAKHMSNEEDREVALLGAFFFMCDPPCPKNRGIAPLLPIVAAMMEASNGMDHPPF